MQQYFSKVPVRIGEDYQFEPDQAHHARNVVRLENETVRIVYEGTGYFGTCFSRGKAFYAHIESEDTSVNEPGAEITAACALIRREKFEWILQKITETGASRIVPFVSSRCVVKAKKEKEERQGARWRQIVQEAAEQCKRNKIPEVTEIRKIEDLGEYLSDVSLAACESERGNASCISDLLKPGQSVTFVIGPEGGFSREETELLTDMGYTPVSLGSRILRAETAAVYACCIAAEINERSGK